jgi:hypothetical protein
VRTSTPFPLLQTYVSTLRRRSRFILLNMLSIIGVVIGVVGFSTQNIVAVIIGIAGLATGLASIVVTTGTWYRQIRDLYVQSLPDFTLQQVKALIIPRRMQDSDYKVLTRPDKPSDGLLTSARVNRALFHGASSRLRLEKERFRVTHSAAVQHVLLRKYTENKSMILFNGHKIRILSDPILSNNDVMTPTRLQQTRYFDTLVTNDAALVRLMSHRDHDEAFNGRRFCFPQNEIPYGEQSACSNQVGASTLAITSDDYLVVVEQGHRSVIAKNKLVPSGSGSADWSDVGDLTDLQQLVKRFAARELMEECGLERKDVGWLRIIGYGRLIERGGLPQFFCLAKLNCPIERIRTTRSERGLTECHNFIDIYEGRSSHYEAIQAAVKELGKENYRISSSLWWNLHLLSLVPEKSIEEAFC